MLAIDTGTAGIITGVFSLVLGAAALVVNRRKDDADVFVRRDEVSWKRMLDSVARADKDRTDMEAKLIACQVHGERCDAALAKAELRIAKLERLQRERGDHET